MFNIKPSTVVACIVAVTIFSLGVQTSAKDGSGYHAVITHFVVTGGPDFPDQAANNLMRLKKFHKSLRQKLGLSEPTTAGDISDLWRKKIGCKDCQKLDTGDAKKLNYYVRDPMGLPAFLEAWDYVQVEESTSVFSISVDGEPGPDPTCNGYAPPCSVNYNCPQWASCSKSPTFCSQQCTH